MVDKDHKCLYRCWTHKGEKMQSCYPHTSDFTRGVIGERDTGSVMPSPLRCGDGKFHNYTVINCKYPDCL